ncbi:MAG: hypothetical protein NTW21_28720 [Verrucomicrobia bacterium]|nr:hypothetical protein [Verrucomicrobiota bacterium]
MKGIVTAFQSARGFHRGFALVVTLSLMILLTIIAVGLLTLAAVALRTSGESEALATARANARLALMLALGDLQQSLGPDQAVTATSGILQSPGKPGLTGVWSSWDYDPAAASLDYTSPKTQTATDSDSVGFRRWLVSCPDPTAVTRRDFGNLPWSGDTITLADRATFGGDLPTGRPIVAGRVPISRNGKDQGACAWHVADESVKARINAYRDPRDKPTLAQQCALLAGHRPDVSVMDKALNFLPKDSTPHEYQQANDGAAKITSLGQVALIGGQDTPKNTLRKFRNDVTPYSLGVLADVRKGGLKRDLSSIFEMSQSSMTVVLPPDYSNKGLYQSTHGITGYSDPKWRVLSAYYNIFKNITNINATPTYFQLPLTDISMPASGSQPTPPTGFAPVPVIAKMQVIFSIVTRNNHWVAYDDTSSKLHLMFTPLVTLHNPYNINISFDLMEVGFDSMPIGFQFTVGSNTNGRLVPFNELYDGSGRTGGYIKKAIVMKIANWTDYDRTTSKTQTTAQIEAEAEAENNQPKSGPITMKPGQTLICAPYLNPSEYFATNGEGTGPGGTTFFDYANSLSRSLKAKPGYNGPFIGLDLDWLNPYGTAVMDCTRKPPNNTPIQVTCGPALPTQGGSASFDVKVKIGVGGTTRDYGGIRFEYPALTDLQGTLKALTFNTTALDSFVDFNDPLSNHANGKPFALFSAYARTTSGGVNESGVRSKNSVLGNALLNGRFAGKPFLFNNPALPIATANLKNSKLGALSYELSLEPVNIGSLNRILQSDATNRTRYLTGNTTKLGTKSGSYLELPLGPMQTIADFRRSNALASPFAPSFVQPVGNSTASPLMHTNKVSERGPDGYNLLDHSVLANHALYDGFYFSTFATDAGSPVSVFNGFMAGTRALASQAFQPYLPEGITAQDAAASLFAGGKPRNDAYKKAAQYQMVQGPFNVNSTNVNAWKAKLASMRGCNVPILSLLTGTKAQQAAVDNPIFPMSLLNAAANDLGLDLATDPGKENRWNGFRQLTNAELDTLARRIVDEVKNRGPFLSMSEFVNRRIGADSELTRRGALEAAIEASGINNGTFTNQVPIQAADISDPAIYGFQTPAVVTGNPAAGAPGWISQGDLMRILEPAATVRSDTFVIRVCGEAKDGDKVVRAYAEAVCQRIPEYVDSSSTPAAGDLTGSTIPLANKRFGRQMMLVSFRWLSPTEI